MAMREQHNKFGTRLVEKLLLKTKACFYLVEKLAWKWATHRPQPG